MSDLILFWHRKDLRIADNIGLASAREITAKVVGVFCLDPQILNRDDVAAVRVTYMIGCLEKLQQRYQEVGSCLFILNDLPEKAIPELATALKAKAVFWNWDVEPYAKQRDRLVTEALKEKGIAVQNFWDQLLHSPEKISTGSNKPYTVYSPFLKNWRSKAKLPPVATLQGVSGITEAEKQLAQQAGAIALPTAKELGFVWDNELVIAPGEDAAVAKLNQFCDDFIYDYKEQRNFPAIDGTSQLSAALKFGVIGIRTVWDKTLEATQNSSTEDAHTSIQSWQQELAWREFYQHAMYWFPQLAAGAYRDLFKTFPWQNNPEYFQAWCEGKTGYPIVDAAMRQMNQIGWMHNRCRMIVANFLTKDLLINLQLGEKYFMQKLIDADLSANNGGWQWSASSGMDTKPVRIFNPHTQAQKFDPNGDYIRRWIPELKTVETKLLLTGKISLDTRKALGYPEPIVDHNQQQRQFKEIYQEQK